MKLKNPRKNDKVGRFLYSSRFLSAKLHYEVGDQWRKHIWNTKRNQRVNVFSTQKRFTVEKWVEEVKQSLPNGSYQVTSKSVKTHLNIIINKNEKIHNFCTLNYED